VEENKSKPKITLKIEETDEGMQPDKVAEALLRGESQRVKQTIAVP
jgi:3-dehydrosphinganine reductase